MIIWKLEINIQGDDWENTEKYFFKTIEETKAFQEKYEKGHMKDDGDLCKQVTQESEKQKLETKFPNVQFRIKRLPPEEAANAWWNKDLD